MAQRQKPTLAAANQFTPMVNKNVQNVETPMCFLKMGDLATPKLVKNSNTSKEALYNSPTPMETQTQTTEIPVDTEVASPKFSAINDSTSLADVKALLLTALNYIEKLEKNQTQSRRNYANASTQTKITKIRKTSSSGSSDHHEKEQRREQVEKKEIPVPAPKEVERPKKKSTSKDKIEKQKPILKQTKQIKPVPVADPIIEQYRLKNSDDSDSAIVDIQSKKKSTIEFPSKSSSDDLTEMKTSYVSKKSSIGSPYSSWSTDSEGKNLQQRMHEMSIILRKLENELDDISTKK